MKWSDLTSPEIGALDRNIPVILNLGAIEQHGPHLPLVTDAFIGELFLDLIDDAFTDDILILPRVQVCCSAHHMDFPGTLSVSHETLMAYVTDIVASVIHHGFKKIILLNSHGGNLAIAGVMMEKFSDRWRDNKFFMLTWWKVAAEALKEIQESDFGGVGHACEFETSLWLNSKPSAVRKELVKNPENPETFDWAKADMLRGSKASYARNMKQISGGSGVVGRPDIATAEKGARIQKAVMEALSPILTDIRNYKID